MPLASRKSNSTEHTALVRRVKTTSYMDFKFMSFTTRNTMNQLYYSKGYRTTEIGGLFCVIGYSKSIYIF